MKLNRKGYMLVEIVVASVLAMTIAYYLLNLTYKFKNTSGDIYQSYYYTNDKILITKNIMSDLDGCFIASVISNPTSVDFKLYNSDNNFPEKRRLVIIKEDTTATIKYGKLNNLGNFITNDVSYYEKELEPTITVGDIKLTNNATSVTITIPITSIYSEDDYSIKLFAKAYIPS